MRISSSENYPGPCWVYLDDVKQEHVLACDPDAGYVELAITDERALYLPRQGSIPYETKFGAVRIELMTAPASVPATDAAARVEAKRALRRFF